MQHVNHEKQEILEDKSTIVTLEQAGAAHSKILYFEMLPLMLPVDFQNFVI